MVQLITLLVLLLLQLKPTIMGSLISLYDVSILITYWLHMEDMTKNLVNGYEQCVMTMSQPLIENEDPKSYCFNSVKFGVYVLELIYIVFLILCIKSNHSEYTHFLHAISIILLIGMEYKVFTDFKKIITT